MDKNKHRLIEYLKEIKNDDAKHFAIYFNFSKLNENNRTDYRIKIAVNIINVFFRDHPIEVFLLDNYDIVVIYEHEDNVMLKKVVFELRYLFIDDPLAFIEENVENSEFCSSYNLHNAWDSCFDDLNKINIEKHNQSSQKKEIELNSSSLAIVDRDIIKSNIFSLIRTQNIVAITGKQVKIISAEIFVSIMHLCEKFDYKLKVNHNSLLFRYITSRLDEHILETLKSRINNYIGRSISINLNVETILSKKFQDFDKMINQNNKKSIIIEINITDVFINITAFKDASEYLQKLGYRVCLDGVNELSFIQVDRATLGVDLIKLQWNVSYLTNPNIKLTNAIEQSGAHRIILCRCDDQKAIEYGKKIGISLFQGWYIDSLNLSE